MGFFSQPNEAAAGKAPLNRERIEQVLKDNNYVFDIDKDGDVVGLWGGNIFFFLRLGKDDATMQTRGRYRHPFTVAQRPAVMDVLNRLHTQWILPKTYVQTDDQGQVWVFGEHSVDLRFGCTNQEIDLNIHLGIRTTLDVFAELKKEFNIPDDKYDQD